MTSDAHRRNQVANEYSQEVIGRITQHMPVRMVRYARTSLVGSERSGVVTPKISQEGPEPLLEMSAAVLQWSRAGHPILKGRRQESYRLPFGAAHTQQEASELRRLVLDIHIGAAALESTAQRAAALDLSKAAREDPTKMWSMICETSLAPMGMLEVGRIVESVAEEQVGARVAYLWHPDLMPAEMSLREMQTTARLQEAAGRQ